MKKILTALLMLSLIVMLLSCADIHVESDSQQLDDGTEHMLNDEYFSYLVE